MATAITHTQTANPFLLAIEGSMKWQGTLVYNRVQLANAAELNAYNAIQAGMTPPGQAMTTDLPAAWAAQLEQAGRLYMEFINLNIVFNNDINADYLIGQEKDPDTLGIATLPSEGQGYMGFNIEAPAHAATASAEVGGISDLYQTFTHEFGHSLGLGHPHDTSGDTTVGGGGAPSDGFNMPVPFQFHYTIMSYTAAPFADPNFRFGRPGTPMPFDIAALQNMYGANTTTRTGDTTYNLFDPRTDPTDLDSADGAIGVGRAYYGVWDAGGSDTIRYDGTARALINLNAATLTATPDASITALMAAVAETAYFQALPQLTRDEITNPTYTAGGFFSSVLQADGNRQPGGYAIANGATIENAVGGGGADLLIGNGVGNRLEGNGAIDVIFGGDGDDLLAGGAGGDLLFGGAGADTSSYAGSDVGVVINLAAGTRSGGHAQGDVYSSIENLIGSAFADTLTALAAGSQLEGGGGGDTLNGGAGFDTLIGGLGNDTLDGGANPAGQGDFLLGGEGDDTYLVDSSLDFVDEGSVFAQFGFGGTDTIVSTVDFFWDLYSVGETLRISPDVVDIGGDGTTAVGGVFDNTIIGNDGINVLFGRGGSDTYRAGKGIDFISFSTLGVPDATGYVANGVNTLVMEVGNSYDILFEFEVGRDKVNLAAYGLASTADLFARGVNDGIGNSYFILGDGFDYLYMVGLELAQLQQGDFIV